MKRLEGKVAIVTGSSSGIGKAIAHTFGREGAMVVVTARRLDICEQVAEQIRMKGGQAVSLKTDVTDESQVDELCRYTIIHFGQLDILVNNAGVFGGGSFMKVTTSDFDRVINTNLRGAFFCCRAGLRVMMKQKSGTIINMSSVAGIEAWAGTGIYSASKHGLMGLTKALADEARSHGIKVCSICPAGVADELVDASEEKIVESQKINPFDIAETAVYLATLGPHAIVRQVVVDRLGAEW
jgi:3-oxoacyl-[acyl-carrier protein] reductase